MPVKICSQVLNGLSINAPVISMPVAPNITIKSGDLLYRVTINNIVYVTNVGVGESYITDIAKNSRTYPDNVECYNLLIGIKYEELESYPYIVLEQFTYDELGKINIEANLSTKCNEINKTTKRILNQYSVKNLNQFGVRRL